jgi:hypothetical protein
MFGGVIRFLEAIFFAGEEDNIAAHNTTIKEDT